MFFYACSKWQVNIKCLSLAFLSPHHIQTVQSVYGLAEEGTQSQSPIHTPSHHCRKGTKEDVEKEVRIWPNPEKKINFKNKNKARKKKKRELFLLLSWSFHQRATDSLQRWFLCFKL